MSGSQLGAHSGDGSGVRGQVSGFVVQSVVGQLLLQAKEEEEARIEAERIAALEAERQAAEQAAAQAAQFEAAAEKTRDVAERNRGYPTSLSSHFVSGHVLVATCSARYFSCLVVGDHCRQNAQTSACCFLSGWRS